jgi:hypothetical protein
MIATHEQTAETTIEPVPAERYFADYSAWSQSMVKTFLKRRRLAQAYYVDRTAVEDPPTDPMRKGTATHTAILEPEKFDDMVEVYPDYVLATNGAVSTKEAKEFRERCRASGRIAMKTAEAAQVRAMADSVRRVCGEWLKMDALKEQSVYWTDGDTGIRCKSRLDWLIETPKAIVVLDLKTTGDASPMAFRKRVEDLKYWLQDATYRDAAKSATQSDKPIHFYFIAVEDKFPFATALHRLDAEDVANAADGRRRAMASLANCLKSGEWAEPWESTINPLPLRRWAFDTSIESEQS